MKTQKYIAISFALAAAICSCEKEMSPITDSSSDLMVFTAVQDEAKTAIEEGHTVWSLDDRIRVFYGIENAEAKLKTGDGSSLATFEVRIPEPAPDYYAVYPASVRSALLDTDTLQVAIAAEQNGVFGDNHIAVAKAVDKCFNFCNANAFLKITLPSSQYSAISVESVGGQALAGTLKIGFKDAAIGEFAIAETSSTVTVKAEGKLAAGDIYIAVLPGVTHTKGLLVKYFNGDEVTGSYFLEKETVTEASKVLSFGEFEPASEWFVSVKGSGTGSGTSRDNAMSATAFKKFISVNADDTRDLKLSILNGATVIFEKGEYDFGDIMNLDYGGEAVELYFRGDSTVFTGADSHRIMTVGNGIKIKFENILFSHSRSTSSSNAAVCLYAGSDVTLKNCSVTDNKNMNAAGDKYNTCAGMSVEAGVTLSIDGCEFARNEASWGASLIVRDDATIRNTSFSGNYGHNGPGNSLYLDASANLTVEGCSFIGNTSSDTHGGAFSASNGVITLKNCLFENNVQTNKNGGAIRLWNSAKATLENCTVKGNHANYGGAIYLENTSEIDIVGGNYEANYAKGGGLVNASANSVVKISGNATVKGNYSTAGHGGAILMDSGVLDCNSVLFEENSNRDETNKTFGGAVASTGSARLTIANCTFRKNYGVCYGGPAVNIQADAELKITGCTFDGNYVNAKGISSSNNNGNYGGGAVRLNSSNTATIEDCVFKNNLVAQSSSYDHSYGGAIYVNSSGKYYINRCHFQDNSATRGGALCVWATGAKVYMNACSFSGNWISHRYGTTIHVEKIGEFCMNNCSIADNTYTTGGTSDWQACWLNLSEVTDGTCISNCSFIGSPRSGAEAAISSKNNALVRFDKIGSDNNWFVNNIIVTESAVSNNKSLANYNKAVTLVYTKRSDNSANGAGGTANSVESPAGNGFYYASECFGDLQWNGGAKYNANYWKWNGNLATGANTDLCPADTAKEYIGKIPAFKQWLDDIGALGSDQLGNSRGTSGWWPGAYEYSQK